MKLRTLRIVQNKMMKIILDFIVLYLFGTTFSFGQKTEEKTLGSYKNGLREGHWYTLDKLQKDTISSFNYTNGKFNGEFYYYYYVGKNHKSKFLTSQLNNYSVWEDENYLIKGSYLDDSLDGLYIEYFENKLIHIIGNYKKGLKVGEFRTYHDNGNLYFIENFEDGKLNGLWQQYYNTGKLREERFYQKNNIVTSNVIEWYDNGNKKNNCEYVYENNQKLNHGTFISYYENGVIQSINQYTKGKPSGDWKGFYENGNIKYLLIYENLIYKSYTEYEENGKVKTKDDTK